MLSRRVTNFIRYILDEWLPPVLRESRIFMYPMMYIWFKGKNVSKNMNFKSVFHTLSDEEYAKYYEEYEYIAKRNTDLSNDSINYILSNLGEEKDISILDVGCGCGYVLKQAYDKGYTNILGVDIAAKSIYPEINIISANIESLPFEDKQFDVVTCNHTLEHVLDLPQAISELKRVAKKLIITVPKQRYYNYTFDLHIHFFPQISYLLKYINEPIENIKYKNIKGDWTVVATLTA